MKKALEILRQIEISSNYCSDCGGLDYCNNHNPNKICGMVFEIEGAIKELQELENRSCSNCNNFKTFNSIVVRDCCSILNVSDIGGCGDYFEPKKG